MPMTFRQSRARQNAECRLCLGQADDELIAPCRCAGSGRWVHRECLDTWRASGQNPRAFTHCCACGFRYKLVKSTVDGTTSTTVSCKTRKLLLRLFAICALGALSARLGWFFRVMPAVLIRYFRTRNQVATKEVQPLRSDLARLAKQYVVEHSPSMGSQQKDEDHAKSFCAVVLYPFEPKLPVEPAERFVKLSVGQLVEVTHETRNGWYFGYLLSDPHHAGYLPKSHVVSFSGFCQMQKMYYSDQADKF
ncbi:unnamed protein product [Cladocopium goreaui]|uniref:Adenosine 3'-phospho 5'-phosphosulfate transporter 1 n=1 Tax=Cladocopium goreaui TaxID=2562237 RepID=A0A9P1GD13_9DINO|nr:unnamed protein product [Cladocopium goreaui]